MLFIENHREEYGVEPICKELPIAPSSFYERKSREMNPELEPERKKRDRVLIRILHTVLGGKVLIYQELAPILNFRCMAKS